MVRHGAAAIMSINYFESFICNLVLLSELFCIGFHNLHIQFPVAHALRRRSRASPSVPSATVYLPSVIRRKVATMR